VRIRLTAARRILRGQGMPPPEIRIVLAGDDPLMVRRLLELHRERLREWLEEQQQLVAAIERSLAGERGPRRRVGRGGSVRRRGHAMTRS
jgi:hypothetical protein